MKPGFTATFCPVDEELILRYLCPKVRGEEVPGEDYLIFNFNLYGDQEPWEIWDMYNERRKNDLRLNKDLYFFSQRKKMTPNGSRMGRTIGSGTWKGVDAAKKVYASGSVIGFRKRFTYENKESVHHGGWIMFEFTLDPSLVGMHDEQEAQKYVLCILRKNEESQEKRKRGDEDDQERVATGDDVHNDCPMPE
ncbi:hypothetical protein M0R45_014588 [Rubus argutus]|uniref:NAC domain-containing protein n=1 Tax=Rubus argutus TaxID=59490 RepID=A0AAW1XM73_RUBAR